MAAALGVTIVKRIPYRGDPLEEFSNKYWLSGVAPVTPTEWKSLYDALIALEKTLYRPFVTAVRAYGYNDDSPEALSVDSHDYAAAGAAVAGTATNVGEQEPAGDQAAWVRWKTSRRTIKGKPIYLRKYYHGAPVSAAAGSPADTMLPAWVTAANTFANTLQTSGVGGFGTITGRGHVDTILAHSVSAFVTTRTLERRGKRP